MKGITSAYTPEKLFFFKNNKSPGIWTGKNHSFIIDIKNSTYLGSGLPMRKQHMCSVIPLL